MTGYQDIPLTGWRREDGRVGIRNHVLLIPVDDISNAAVLGVENVVRGTLAIPHPYGRLQFGADLDLTFETLIGYGRNPNVAAAVVVGIEPNWSNHIAERIAETGKPVEAFSIERTGDLQTIADASRVAQRFVQQATELPRVPVEWSEILVSTKCGESDTTSGLASNPTVGRVFDRLEALGATMIFGETTEVTGAEDKIVEQCATPEVAAQFQQAFDDYQDLVKSQGVNLMGSQPTEGNIRGGLSTIEEKALGNVEKAGRCTVVGYLDQAEAPNGPPGLYFMDSSSAAAEHVTLCCAAGAVLHLFTTGQGNIVGNPVLPTIKITANPLTAETMSEHIDVDVSGMLRFEYPLDGAADRTMEIMARTINGRLTCAETLRHDDFVITKLYRSA